MLHHWVEVRQMASEDAPMITTTKNKRAEQRTTDGPVFGLRQGNNSLADPIGKRSFHLLLKPDVYVEAKVKCVREDVNLSDVINELLLTWVSGKIKLKLPKRRNQDGNG
jgi:hypothetical protein